MSRANYNHLCVHIGFHLQPIKNTVFVVFLELYSPPLPFPCLSKGKILPLRLMYVWGAVPVQLHSFLISTLLDVMSASRSDCFTSGTRLGGPQSRLGHSGRRYVCGLCQTLTTMTLRPSRTQHGFEARTVCSELSDLVMCLEIKVYRTYLHMHIYIHTQATLQHTHTHTQTHTHT